jgi:hypothetical protein
VVKISLWGLDVIVKDDKYILNEFNGIYSGMKGFEYIYKDDRVIKKICSMLEEKHGKNLAVNKGKYLRNKLKKIFHHIYGNQ